MIKIPVYICFFSAVFGLCGCSGSQDHIKYTVYYDKNEPYLDIRLDRGVLSRFSDDKLRHYLADSSLFDSDLRLSFHREISSFHRACRYDRWNQRFVIEDHFGEGSIRSFRSFDEFIAQMLVFEHISLNDIMTANVPAQSRECGQIGMIYTVSLMTFPPPFNLLMSDRYRIRVRGTIKL